MQGPWVVGDEIGKLKSKGDGGAAEGGDLVQDVIHPFRLIFTQLVLGIIVTS